jgi:hypothetical protein
VLGAVEEGIEKVKRQALVVATQASPNKYDGMVASWADAQVRLSSERDRIRAELVKHRNRLPAETTFRLDQLLRATRTGGAH